MMLEERVSTSYGRIEMAASPALLPWTGDRAVEAEVGVEKEKEEENALAVEVRVVAALRGLHDGVGGPGEAVRL